jgi:hypothetical protein
LCWLWLLQEDKSNGPPAGRRACRARALALVQKMLVPQACCVRSGLPGVARLVRAASTGGSIAGDFALPLPFARTSADLSSFCSAPAAHSGATGGWRRVGALPSILSRFGCIEGSTWAAMSLLNRLHASVNKQKKRAKTGLRPAPGFYSIEIRGGDCGSGLARLGCRTVAGGWWLVAGG